MTRRSSRADALVDHPALIAALGPCRSAVISEMTRAKPAGPLYYSGATVNAAIDALALMLRARQKIAESVFCSNGVKGFLPVGLHRSIGDDR